MKWQDKLYENLIETRSTQSRARTIQSKEQGTPGRRGVFQNRRRKGKSGKAFSAGTEARRQLAKGEGETGRALIRIGKRAVR